MTSRLAYMVLALGSAALVAAGGIVLSGCGHSYNRADYQAVVNEVNEKYHVQMHVDVDGGMNISPEQLRVHLEAMARNV